MGSRGISDICYREKRCGVKFLRKVGLSLPIDGSYDDELSVKGILEDEFQVGDW